MWVIVPVKRFNMAKQRLSAVASPTQRQELARAMAERVLSELGSSRVIDGVLVVSNEPSLKRYAGMLGMQCVSDADRGLNDAIDMASRVLDARQAMDIAIVHADLPLFCVEEFDRVAALHRAGSERKMTIVADTTGEGTNLRFCRPGLSVAPLFGKHSAVRHARFALYMGLCVEVISSPTLSLDCDTPADVDRILRLAEPASGVLLEVSLFASKLGPAGRETLL